MTHPHHGHTIEVERFAGRVVVRFGGEVVADSRAALRLDETGCEPVFYLPRADVRGAALQPSTHTSHCPFKGDASYWTLRTGTAERVDAAWSYEQPLDAVAAIAGCIAFYPHRVDSIETL